jgi:HSP20 family protein
MLMRTDPFRDLDRLAEAMWGAQGQPAVMPMTAYRDAGAFVVHLDLPGVNPDDIEATVERNVLTIRAQRSSPVPEDGERLIDERSYGEISRQLVLGETLAVDDLTAAYDAGVLTLRIPIAEQAAPRKVEIKAGTQETRELAG